MAGFKNSISIKAGKSAGNLIEKDGFGKESVKVVAGAAGGPKWLILRNLDKAVFGQFLKDRVNPLPLIGSSIGTWRFACVCCNDQEASFKRFEESYIKQSYKENHSSAYISSESLKILDYFIKDKAREILDHPVYRLNIMTAKCRWPASSSFRLIQALGFGIAITMNLIKRESLNTLFKRGLYYDKRMEPNFFKSDQFKIEYNILTAENLKKALLASGSIPVIMDGVEINGSVYRDGGIIDYNMDLKYENTDGIVLFPHYSEKIIPGWLDKNLKKRVPFKETTDKMLLIAPSKEMIDSLPNKKIPDRKDFMNMDDDTRIKVWNEVLEKSRIMFDDFMHICEDTGRLLDVMEKL